MSRKLYGRGLRFPLIPGPGMQLVDGEEVVAQAIRSVLLTQPGERLRHPRYGAGLRRFLFESNSVTLRATIKTTVIDAIERDEPRVVLDGVEVTTDSSEPTLLRIDVRYRLTAKSSPRNLVFPFYLEEAATT